MKAVQNLRQENDRLQQQLTALATELADPRERIGRTSRNSSKLPSSGGLGLKIRLKNPSMSARLDQLPSH